MSCRESSKRYAMPPRTTNGAQSKTSEARLRIPNESNRKKTTARSVSVPESVVPCPRSWAAAIAITPTCSIIVASISDSAIRTRYTKPDGDSRNRAISVLVTARFPVRAIKGSITQRVPMTPIPNAALLNATSNTANGTKAIKKPRRTSTASRPNFGRRTCAVDRSCDETVFMLIGPSRG